MNDFKRGTVVKFKPQYFPSGWLGYEVDGITAVHDVHLWGMGERVGIVIEWFSNEIPGAPYPEIYCIVRLTTGEFVTTNAEWLDALDYVSPILKEGE